MLFHRGRHYRRSALSLHAEQLLIRLLDGISARTGRHTRWLHRLRAKLG